MSFSMQDLMAGGAGSPEQQPKPAASTPQAPQPTQPSAAAAPAATSDAFSMNELMGQPNAASSAPQRPAPMSVPDPMAAYADKKDAEEKAQKAEASKHGLLRRSWDWVNTPILDNALPDGVKTSDILKAAAFESVYHEMYLPGVNDFETKAVQHFEQRAPAADKKVQEQQKKGAIKQFLAKHKDFMEKWTGIGEDSTGEITYGGRTAADLKAYRDTAVAGMSKDAADMAASFTSPLAIATYGLGPLGKTAGPIGKAAKVLAPLAGTAFGAQGAYQGGKGLYHMSQEGITPETAQETLGGLGQAALGGAGAMEPLAQGYRTSVERVRPEIKTIGGQEVPVRATGTLPEAIAKTVEPSVIEKGAAKTAAAVQQGVGNVVGEAVGSDADTAIHGQDRFGVRAHAEDLKGKAVPAYQELDRLSGNAFSDAQVMERNSRLDFSTEGREKFQTAKALQDEIFDRHRAEMAKNGYDVDEMRANYRKQSALNDIADKLDQATSAHEGDYRVNGEKLANVIDRMRRVPGEKNLFQRAGMTEEHIQSLADLADTLKGQQEVPKVGTLSKLVAKGVALAMSGGSVSGLGEALIGESAAEKIGSKLMTRLYGEAMASEPAAKAIKQAVQKGDPSIISRIVAANPQLVADIKAMFSGSKESQRGSLSLKSTAAAGEKKLTPIPTETNPDFKMTPKDNGDIEMMHPNGESQMVLHPEPDTRPGMEGKTQLRQTGISAVDHPGAGQEMMDEAVNRLKGSEKYSRVISDHPDRRSPDNERHWERLAKRGHDVQTEPSKDSFGDEWDSQFNLEPTSLNAGEGGKAYYIDTKPGEMGVEGNRPQSEISTRAITSTKKGVSTLAPNDVKNATGWDAIEAAEKEKPGFMQDLLDKVLSYKDNGLKLSDEEVADPRKGLKAVINHWADNLTWLHDNMPEAHRTIAKQWYDSAHKMAQDIAAKHGTSPEKVAAVIAALSPQNPWDMNVGQAERIVKIYQTALDHPWTSEMDQAVTDRKVKALKGKEPNVEFANQLESLRGKTWADLTVPGDAKATRYNQALWMRMLDEAHGSPQTPVYAPDGKIRSYQKFNWGLADPMAKSIDIMESDGSSQAIHDIIGDGHKIRNFYNNIISPNSEAGHATIDTHHVNADMLKPMSSKNDVEVKDNFGGAPGHKGTGQKGTYSLHHAALKQAAEARGILPREMQSITWEAIKTLMGDEKKTPELRKAVTDIWQKYQNGDLTLQQARENIVKAAGGFDRPGWAKEREINGEPRQSNTGGNEAGGSTPNPTELPAVGVPGESPVAAEPRGRGDVSRAVPNEGGDVYEAVKRAPKVTSKVPAEKFMKQAYKQLSEDWSTTAPYSSLKEGTRAWQKVKTLAKSLERKALNPNTPSAMHQIVTLGEGGEHSMTVDANPPDVSPEISAKWKDKPQPLLGRTPKGRPDYAGKYGVGLQDIADHMNLNEKPETMALAAAHEVAHALIQHHLFGTDKDMSIGLGNKPVRKGRIVEGTNAKSTIDAISGGSVAPGATIGDKYRAAYDSGDVNQMKEFIRDYTTQLMGGRAMEEMLGRKPQEIYASTEADRRMAKALLARHGIRISVLQDALLDDSTARAKEMLKQNWDTAHHITKQAVQHYGKARINNETFHKYREGGKYEIE